MEIHIFLKTICLRQSWTATRPMSLISSGTANWISVITIVPRNRRPGIAAQLVKATYDYALQHHLQPIATCSYAVVWLQRHPEYHGHPGKDYGGCSSCAL